MGNLQCVQMPLDCWYTLLATCCLKFIVITITIDTAPY